MIDLSKFTDPYDRKARLYPALICLFPIIMGTAISFPTVFSTLSGLMALAAAIGSLQFLSHLSRDRGKALESELFKMWGGMPSVTVFRFRDKSIPSPAKLKYHAVLSKKSGINGPTKEMEEKEPQIADDIYLSWSDFLRGKTRDAKKFPMVFKENINYGFRRNLLGIKWLCVLSGIIGLIILFAPALTGNKLTGTINYLALIIVVYVFIFIFVVKSSWVKVVAEAYGKQLIEAVNA